MQKINDIMIPNLRACHLGPEASTGLKMVSEFAIGQHWSNQERCEYLSWSNEGS